MNPEPHVSLLVVGGGGRCEKLLHILIGREHALVWGLNKSERCNKIFWTPGNPAVAKVSTNSDLMSYVMRIWTKWSASHLSPTPRLWKKLLKKK